MATILSKNGEKINLKYGSFRFGRFWHAKDFSKAYSYNAIANNESFLRGIILSIAIVFFVVISVAKFLSVFNEQVSFYDAFRSVLGCETVYAKEVKPYEAIKLIQSAGTVNVKAGDAITFKVGFKNIGTATWYKDGVHFMAINTAEPYYRLSNFRHKFWRKYDMPAKMVEDVVRPGQIGYFRFALQAPKEAGYYEESFRIAAENLRWVTGGLITIPINVIANNNISNTNVATLASSFAAPTTSSASGLAAQKLIQSAKRLDLRQTVSEDFTIGYKNTGNVKWEVGRVTLRAMHNRINDDSWINVYKVVKNTKQINPGEIAYFNFKVKATTYAGGYDETFVLIDSITGKNIFGSGCKVTVSVDGPPQAQLVSNNTSANNTVKKVTSLSEQAINSNIEQSIMYTKEPVMRVGLFHTTDNIRIKGNKNFVVYSGNNKLLEPAIGEEVLIKFDFNQKKYILNNSIYLNNSPIRFVSNNIDSIFTVTNYENRPLWNKAINDNMFRGIIEINYAQATGRLWVINELSIEQYLKGIAETSNDSHFEFQKTLVVAARTYAIYHYNRQTKHASENFYVDSQYDQLYRGYSLEKRNPNVARAVDATRGQIVTYNNKVAITPYFSQSDGRTRSWSEVWYGSSPGWLVSVPDPYCAGKSLLGHGVGMSARGALNMAYDGESYENILKYYYTGIDVKKVY